MGVQGRLVPYLAGSEMGKATGIGGFKVELEFGIGGCGSWHVPVVYGGFE